MPKAAYNHLYGRRWKVASKAFLKRNPFCSIHQARGELAMATLVDHRIPHRGDRGLFWDQDNWQGLCKPCHDGPKQRLEKSGRVAGCDEQGIPLDPAHPWNTEGRDSCADSIETDHEGVGRSHRTLFASDTAPALF